MLVLDVLPPRRHHGIVVVGLFILQQSQSMRISWGVCVCLAFSMRVTTLFSGDAIMFCVHKRLSFFFVRAGDVVDDSLAIINCVREDFTVS